MDEGEDPLDAIMDTTTGAASQNNDPTTDPAHDDHDEDDDDDDDQDDDEDPFASGLLSRHHPGHLSSTLRALTGIVGNQMLGGMGSRLRGILENLRQKDDPSMQLIALQDLSELLLVSTEDNLAGHFQVDAFVKELITLMQPSEMGEENPEIMLLACRCIANLMEALPQATATVAYEGAIPILCQKLLEIHFIDLAEQALSTLEKISVEFPAMIVREGGLTACLSYLDFFATSTQRTAVTTAANCCRNIPPEESFPVIRDVMPILQNVLNSSDQRVLEQGCNCVSRIVKSYADHYSKLEELISDELLRTVLRLLLPGNTNLISPGIHTDLLKVLAITAKASPKHSAALFKMNVVDTLYQILTGVSPPGEDEKDVATKIDSVVIMQALIHRPRDQIVETLNVICELLPDIWGTDLTFLKYITPAGYPNGRFFVHNHESKLNANEKRMKLLEGCKKDVHRFAVILLPTLTDAYSSTVNPQVRERVLTAHLKMLSNLDTDILHDALRSVPYASFLASMLTQLDNPSLITYALQAAELLLKRLESVYRYHFYREGVMSEIAKLANRPSTSAEKSSGSQPTPMDIEPVPQSSTGSQEHSENEEAQGFGYDHSEDEDDDEEDEDEGDDHDDNDTESDGSSSEEDDYSREHHPSQSDDEKITERAKKFLEIHETNQSMSVKAKASSILEDLAKLAQQIRQQYLEHGQQTNENVFERLAIYFDIKSPKSITSYELLTSDIVQVLLDVMSQPQSIPGVDARTDFLHSFMRSSPQLRTGSKGGYASTPFSSLVQKLQDLLSRAEHFEVFTVPTSDSSRHTAASMLAKQLRLRLMADDESGIPSHFRNIMVNIHAIATFKGLDDYLRPRIALAERPKGTKGRESMTNALAAYAAAMSGRDPFGAGNTHRRDPLPPAVPTPGDFTNRQITKHQSKSRSKHDEQKNAQSGSSSTPTTKSSGIRRSTRKSNSGSLPSRPVAPVMPDENLQDTLECADEAPLSEDEEMDENSELDNILGGIEDDDDDDDEADPSAVNMEVAPTGKVTARREDGTRIATPVSTSSKRAPSARVPSTQRLLSTNSPSASRPSSYLSAVQAMVNDWHIEFSINDQPITHGTTIYRAVHFNQGQPTEVSSKTMWHATHQIKFKRVAGPPPPETTAATPPPESSTTDSGVPMCLEKNPVASTILRFLNILHGLNANIEDVVSETKDQARITSEPLSQFVNTKLTAKMNRQLEEPLIVASACLPSWSTDLARYYPFLLPFETRHLFLQSTSFGYSRSMNRWQNAQAMSESRNDRHRDERPFLGRLQRQKVRISRQKILESALKVMDMYGSSPSILEVEYFDEVGTGLGPTLEFYSTISKEFAKKRLKLWRENDANEKDEYAFGKQGLFPAPMSGEQSESDNGKRILQLFKSLGKFVARSMLDSRIIDISFNPTFFRIGEEDVAVTPSLGAVSLVDNDLANSLKLLKKFASAKKHIDEDGNLNPALKVEAIQNIEINGARVEDLALDFTLPGYDIELLSNGRDIPVTIDNVGMYLEKVIDFTLGSGVRRQVEAFRQGFSQVFPYSSLRAFTPDELVMLFGRLDEDWSLETLMDSIKADHGFNLDSKSVRNLLQIMSQFSPNQRRNFLQFVTGSPKLPIGGK
ncbi:hypothetical protein P152DRAFT_150684 [Eremomyces bilateralis CBS 781.70]|uniref:HECT-type E3 ubiquitin transferase n=1 Tax=Eremomyces bilateralis CBS 781.70 TaxID=1392243 RepID=A0A6G1FVT4_9PEZI|nr:uncharacterized protein P152DRAFT_150684 [Eremomyces bilateralis CBS 781.70]KAF1809810.1 hypothetical protein P152DRAFT_150684 [Eremomyces bilateralis CBS 781.70]